MIDRSYQPLLISQARLKLREISARLKEEGITRKPRLMVQLAAGGGKTMLSAMMASAALERDGRVAFLCHRDYLLYQTANTYKSMGIRHSYLAAGKPLNPKSKTHIGMIGSLKSRQHKIEAPSLAFSDEAHHGVATTWKEAIEKWPDTTFIGLSATPGARTDGKGLDEIYDDIVCGPSVSELIALGALSDYRWFQGRPPAELMALKLGRSDAADKQAEILDKPVIIGDMVGNYRQKAMGKKAVYFAPNVKMSMDLADAFNAAGVPFQHMDKDTPDWKRKSIAKAIARGELLGFTNVAIAGEGFDLAAQADMDVTIEVTGLCRKTASLPLLIQMAMRCMRAKDEPGLIFDHCDNYSEHQWLPDDDIEWTLQGAIRKPREAKAVQCPHCLATGYPEKGCCKGCGKSLSKTVAAIAARAQMEVIEGELAEVERAAHEAAKSAAVMDRKRAIASLNRSEEIIAYGRKMGYKDGWAKKLIEVKRERGRLVA